MTYTTLLITISTFFLSICSGLLGPFLLLRKQSLLADTISHCTLAGIMGAFLLIKQYDPWILLFGAFISGTLSLLCIHIITYYTHHAHDTALGITLSFFFGIGLLCMTLIQKKGSPHLSLLYKFLFGNITTLLREDCYLIALGACSVSILCLLFWKEFILITFDPLYASTISGAAIITKLLMFLSLITIVIGISMIGTILMSSLLITSAAAARQWTRNLPSMVFFSSVFAFTASCVGIFISNQFHYLPTGPAIVVVISYYAILSLLFGKIQA